MRFFLPGLAAATIILAAPAGPALAQGANSTITMPDGTTIVTTFRGLNDINIQITGGPEFGPSPATVNFTSVVPGPTAIDYTGSITRGGVTSPFTCQVNTATQAVTGTGACAVAFGQATTPPATPTTPPVVTPPTTPPPTTPPTTTPPPTTPPATPPPTTPPPATPTTPTTPTAPPPPPVIDDGSITVTNPDGTVVRLSLPEQQLISFAEADQLVASLLGDRVQIGNLETFVTQRLRAIGTAALQANLQQFTDKGGYRGASAGSQTPSTGLWVNATGTYVEDDRTGASQDGYGGAVALGLDYTMGATILGAYVGHSRSDLDGTNVSYESDGWNGGLYASLSPAPVFRVTAAVGYGDYDVGYGRTAGALRSFGETSRTQTHASLTFESPQTLGDAWVVVPSLGVAVSSSETDAYQDNANRPIAGNDVDMTLVTGGASLFYTGGTWLPYVTASFNHETDGAPGADSDYGVIGAGVAIPLAARISLAVTGQALVGKSGEKQTSLGVTLRRAF